MYPHERSLVKRLANEPFALIGMNSDPLQKVKDARKNKNLTWRSFWDGGSTRGPIATAWGVRGWPTIYVIDDRGIIRYKGVRGERMDKAVDELLAKAVVTLVKDLQSEDAGVRGLAAYRMGKYNAPDAKGKLSELLDDKQAVVQQRAATGLALLGQPTKPLLPLLRKAVGDKEADVRADSLTALGSAGDKQSLPLAIAALDDKSSDVRQAAVTALVGFKDSRSIDPLAKAVGDENSQIAKAAAFSLAKLNSTESNLALQKLAANRKHTARVWIAAALHRPGDKTTADRFKQLLSDDDVEIRRQAATAVGELAKLDTTDLYIGALDDKDSQVRKIARTSLKSSKDPRAVEALKKNLSVQVDELVAVLTGRDYRKRSKALAELKELGPDVAPLLIDSLETASTQAKYSLASAIGRMRNPKVIPSVAEKLKNPKLDRISRSSFETVLRYLGSQGRSTADDLIGDKEPAVRESGVRLLAFFRDADAVESLKGALKDSSPLVRVNAAVVLASRKDQDALSVLKDSAKERDPQVRSLAVRGLASYGSKTAMPIFTELAKQGDRTLGVTLVGALGRFKEKQATDLIVELAKQDVNVRFSAIYALQRQNTADAARALGEFLKDKNSNVQRQAKSALQRMRIPEAKKVLEEASKPESSGTKK